MNNGIIKVEIKDKNFKKENIKALISYDHPTGEVVQV